MGCVSVGGLGDAGVEGVVDVLGSFSAMWERWFGPAGFVGLQWKLERGGSRCGGAAAGEERDAARYDLEYLPGWEEWLWVVMECWVPSV